MSQKEESWWSEKLSREEELINAEIEHDKALQKIANAMHIDIGRFKAILSNTYKDYVTPKLPFYTQG